MTKNTSKILGFAMLATFFWAAAIVLSKAALDDIHSNQLFYFAAKK